MTYQSGEEIRIGDRVLLHGEPGEVELLLDGEHNTEDWPAEVYGSGIVIAEPKVFGRLFLPEDDLKDYEDLEFVSRAAPLEP